MQKQSTHDQTLEEARLQALEYLGLAAPKRITAGDEVFTIPNPSSLTAEQQRRYDELQLALEDLARWPDKKNDAGEVIRLGELRTPHRTKDGELVDNYDLRLAKAILGEDVYARYEAKGGRASDIALFWWQMNKQVAERRAADSKSDGSAADLAAVPDADRV